MSEYFDWPSIANEAIPIADTGYVLNSIRLYYWQVVVGGILAFAMAWGIGANDVANAFATSVGAGSLSLPMACVIAAIMEFAGAVLLGGSVTTTVRKSIIKPDFFDPNQGGPANGSEMLMTGFMISLVSATLWLILATFFSLPVSTTHSIIGSLIGVGLAFGGSAAVVWWPDKPYFEDKMKGVVGVILSWVISPILSGIIAVIFFLFVRFTILRRKNPFQNGLFFIPFFYGAALTVAIFFVIYKGDGRFDLADKLGAGITVGIAFAAGLVFAIFSKFVLVPLAKRFVERWEERELEKGKVNADSEKLAHEKSGDGKNVAGILSKVGINVHLDEELSDDVVRMHDVVEKFDPKTERLFTWVQIFTAAVDSFAHGANDVANAVAPFTSVFQLYWHNGRISAPLEKSEDTFENVSELPSGVAAEDPLWDHKPLCGKEGETEYRACAENPVFPYKEVAPGPGKFFTVYNADGTTDGERECYEECYPRNAFAYDDYKQEVPIWILAMGGAGIVAGLAMWGYRIILAIGVKLTKLTPSRGFSIEIGAAITVLIASQIGLPVSTTHCQVGATMGVGLVEGKLNSVNWKQFFFICVGWVFTVIFTGFVSAVLYLIVVSSPSKFGEQESPDSGAYALGYCPGNQVFVYDDQDNTMKGVLCSGIDLDHSLI